MRAANWRGDHNASGTRREEETKVTVVSKYAEYSAASLDIASAADPGTVRTQPMRVAKLHRRIVVDARNWSHPNPAVSNGSFKFSYDASDSSSHTSSDSSTSTATPPPPAAMVVSSPFLSNHLRKSFAALPSPSKPTVKVECIDVDDASSSAARATLLGESDPYRTDYVES